MEHPRTLGFTAFAVGALSLALLGASIAWAHHWSVRADALVAGWGVSTLAALVLSSLALRGSSPVAAGSADSVVTVPASWRSRGKPSRSAR